MLRNAKLGRTKDNSEQDVDSAKTCMDAVCKVVEREIEKIIQRNTDEYWDEEAKKEFREHYRKQIFAQYQLLDEVGSRASSGRPKRKPVQAPVFSFEEVEREYEEDENAREDTR